MAKVSIVKSFTFEAAHHLPHHTGKCRRPHGHSYRLEVEVSGFPHKVDPQDPQSHEGMVMDFADLSNIVKQTIIDPWDHQDLNQVVGIPVTTAELLAMEIFDLLLPRVRGLSRVRLYETATSYVEVQ